MKNKVKILIISVLFISVGKIIPQDSTLSIPEIKNYIQFLEKENGKLSEKELMNQPLDYIKKIASMRYQAYDKDYIGTQRYFEKRKGLAGMTFAIISRKLGNRVANLIQVSYLLELQIYSIETIQHHSSINLNYPRVEIKAKVLEAIKGNSKFKSGDSITFYYNCHNRLTNYDFKNDETVFAAINVLDYKNTITNFLSLGRYDGTMAENSSFGRYPIENGILIDSDNAWGYGKSLPWEEFKGRLTQDINIIISGVNNEK
jgi:hypothetical protein